MTLVVNCLSWVLPEADPSQANEGSIGLQVTTVGNQDSVSLGKSGNHCGTCLRVTQAGELGSWGVCPPIPTCHLLALCLGVLVGTVGLPCMWVSVPSQPRI